MTEIDDLNKKAVKLQKDVWKDTSLWKDNFTTAIAILEAALKFNPNDVVTLTNLGAACCDLGNHEKAKPFLEKAIQLGSLDKNTYFNLGVACINTQSIHLPHFNKANTLTANDKTWEAYFDPHAH